MGLQPDSSPYGSQTVMGPGWPNVDEESLALAASQYEALATKISGSVVPQQQGQLTNLQNVWHGAGSLAAAGEATTIIGGHESHAAQAAAIAAKLRTMEVTVARTKALVNATALETQQECMAIQQAAAVLGNAEALIQSRIKMGLSQNIAYVNANSAELAGGLGVPPSMPTPGAPPAAGAAQQAGQKGSDQGMQMLSQMGQMAGQLMGMVTQAPQQMMQPLQQLAQPLQQLTSMFGGGQGAGGAAAMSPFSAFSNHPLAGGAGAGGGAGLVKAAALPGSSGVGAQTPLLGSLVGGSPMAAATAPSGAGSAAVGGVAPVAVGAGAGMGGMGMMGGQRGEGEGGGTVSSLAPPTPLDYDLGEDVDDDW